MDIYDEIDGVRGNKPQGNIYDEIDSVRSTPSAMSQPSTPAPAQTGVLSSFGHGMLESSMADIGRMGEKAVGMDVNMPEPVQPSGWIAEQAHGLGKLAGDFIPMTVGGAVGAVGGGGALSAVTGGAAAFMAPELIHQAAKAYIAPEPFDVGEAAKEVGTSGLIGAATSLTGYGVMMKALAPEVRATYRAAIKAGDTAAAEQIFAEAAQIGKVNFAMMKYGKPAAEVAAMTTGGALSQGKLPTAGDFASGAFQVAALHKVQQVAGGIRKSREAKIAARKAKLEEENGRPATEEELQAMQESVKGEDTKEKVPADVAEFVGMLKSMRVAEEKYSAEKEKEKQRKSALFGDEQPVAKEEESIKHDVIAEDLFSSMTADNREPRSPDIIKEFLGKKREIEAKIAGLRALGVAEKNPKKYTGDILKLQDSLESLTSSIEWYKPLDSKSVRSDFNPALLAKMEGADVPPEAANIAKAGGVFIGKEIKDGKETTWFRDPMTDKEIGIDSEKMLNSTSNITDAMYLSRKEEVERILSKKESDKTEADKKFLNEFAAGYHPEVPDTASALGENFFKSQALHEENVKKVEDAKARQLSEKVKAQKEYSQKAKEEEARIAKEITAEEARKAKEEEKNQKEKAKEIAAEEARIAKEEEKKQKETAKEIAAKNKENVKINNKIAAEVNKLNKITAEMGKSIPDKRREVLLEQYKKQAKVVDDLKATTTDKQTPSNPNENLDDVRFRAGDKSTGEKLVKQVIVDKYKKLIDFMHSNKMSFMFVNSFKELPNDIQALITKASKGQDPRESLGMYVKGRGIYIITENAHNMKDLHETVKHEFFHKGYEDFLSGPEKLKFMALRDEIWKAFESEIKEFAGKNEMPLGTSKEKIVAIDEFMADKSHAHKQENLFQRFYGMVRNVFRKMGIVDMNESDLQNVIGRSLRKSGFYDYDLKGERQSIGALKKVMPESVWREGKKIAEYGMRTIEEKYDAMGRLTDSLWSRSFAPTTRSERAHQTGAIISENESRLANYQAKVRHELKEYYNQFSNSDLATSRGFMQWKDTGKAPEGFEVTPEWIALRDHLKAEEELKVKTVREVAPGLLQTIRENYMPHLWKPRQGNDAIISGLMSKRPYEGSKAFSKERIYDDFQAGIDAGLVPISENPLDIWATKMYEIDKFIAARKALIELKPLGYAELVKSGEKAPEGFVKIEDRYSKDYTKQPVTEFVLRDGDGNVLSTYANESKANKELEKMQQEGGEYTVTKEVNEHNYTQSGEWYAPDDVAQIFHNHLSRSLYSNKYVGSAYGAYMSAGGLLNQSQLGIGSMFHAGMVTGEAVVSTAALGLKQAYRASIGKGSFRNAAKTIMTAPFSTIGKGVVGGRMLHEILSPGEAYEIDKQGWRKFMLKAIPDSEHMDMKYLVNAYMEAGGQIQHLKRDAYVTDVTQQMKKAFASGEKIKGAALSPFALIEASAKPIMEKLVPRQKLGMFAELMHESMKIYPDMTHAERRIIAREIWNRVDSRLGQVVYDRLFMHNVAKGIIQAVVRAPGWTGGTIAEIGGSAIDANKFVKEWIKTGKPPEELPDRVAYTMSLLAISLIANGLATAVFTGENPKDINDLFAFRTGNFDEDGRPERMLYPMYTKDLVSYSKNAPHTIMAKTHPLITLATDIAYKNKDYYGTEIRNKDDATMQQVADMITYSAKQFVPFWMRGAGKEIQRTGVGEDGFVSKLEKTAEEKPWSLVAPLIGIMPASSEYTRSKAELLQSEILRERRPAGSRTKEAGERLDLERELRQGYKKNHDMTQIKRAISEGKISPEQAKSIIKGAGIAPLVRDFDRLGATEAFEIYKVATKEERNMLKPKLAKKVRNEAKKRSQGERVALLEKYRTLLRESDDTE